ncbi:cell division protein FtsJ [Paenibacillus sp. VCA1]|uniref:cyclic-phosphate processing receiver domain-containing protein n=1 Tax=Paenibacillus sp. VCA1 TaxID=3039148 RepID=UPI002871AD75|nr:cyclic-phosphate processing receiver domain-containing protein [Paenibacillus sp. VCA1]MDR9854095.1 cell division protein FtsJ [Paenibacillus sp. VCA1]
MLHVYLDDYRRCPDGFVLARNAQECLIMLEECEVGILSLDYDLGIGEPTGKDVVRGMIAGQLFPREIFLHTSSMRGKREMYELLYQSVPEHVKLHNGPMPQELLERIAKEERS